MAIAHRDRPDRDAVGELVECVHLAVEVFVRVVLARHRRGTAGEQGKGKAQTDEFLHIMFEWHIALFPT